MRSLSRGRRVSFSEFWMPVREIGGISRANLAGVVYEPKRKCARDRPQRKSGGPRSDAGDRTGDKTVFQEKADLIPQRTWTHELANADPQQKYSFEVRDANDAVLLHQTEGQYDWTPIEDVHVGPQPSYQIPEPERRSEDDWLQLGNDEELDGNLLTAMQTYQDALTKFSESLELRKAAGRLYASLLRFPEAKPLLEPVQARNTSDPEVSYYLRYCVRRPGPEPTGTRIVRSRCSDCRGSAPHPTCVWRNWRPAKEI